MKLPYDTKSSMDGYWESDVPKDIPQWEDTCAFKTILFFRRAKNFIKNNKKGIIFALTSLLSIYLLIISIGPMEDSENNQSYAGTFFTVVIFSIFYLAFDSIIWMILTGMYYGIKYRRSLDGPNHSQVEEIGLKLFMYKMIINNFLLMLSTIFIVPPKILLIIYIFLEVLVAISLISYIVIVKWCYGSYVGYKNRHLSRMNQ